MKAILVWTLSFLMAWEPFALAASNAKSTGADFKNYLEFTHITQKRMTISELYYKSYGFLPKHVREELKPMVEKMGDYLLPKFDVTKVKGPNGEDAYQLSASQDGKSFSFVVLNNETTFMRVNGHDLSAKDLMSTQNVMTKFGLNSQQVAEVANIRTPASTTGGHGLLSAEQIQRMSKAQQRQYFKQFRDLLQSMEEVQHAFNYGKKTSSNTKTSADKYSVLFNLISADALADQDVAGNPWCTAAGYNSNVAWNAQRLNPQTNRVEPGWSCGTDGHGNVPEYMRKKSDGSLCNSNEFACNPVIYGSYKSCAPAGAATTQICNSQVTGSDIPDLAKNYREFNNLKIDAENMARGTSATCGEVTINNARMRDDQRTTCENLKARLATIQSWDCARPEFAKKYTKLCGDPVFNPPPVAGQPPVAQQPPVAGQPPVAQQPPVVAQPVDDGQIHCDHLPDNMSLTQSSCDGGTAGAGYKGADGQQKYASCMNGDKAQSAYMCVCDDGNPVVGKMKCAAVKSNTADDDSSAHSRRHRKSKTVKSTGPNWWIIAAAGLAGLGLFYWIDKTTMKSTYTGLSNILTTPTPVTIPPPRIDPGVR